eukprot:TRINITY_DN1953_c0_g1_i1.p1 TRINITY_DN1953_c0_g1~~TRINITY_DN1953_c0_g1_i1.p1  ORF type:complete len:334 (+),score=62.59 TRINITY_DN1953_c0_g1_i1:45-1004(+)
MARVRHYAYVGKKALPLSARRAVYGVVVAVAVAVLAAFRRRQGGRLVVAVSKVLRGWFGNEPTSVPPILSARSAGRPLSHRAGVRPVSTRRSAQTWNDYVPDLVVGDVVQVRGLLRDEELNGSLGRVAKLASLTDGSPGAVISFPQKDRKVWRLLRLTNLLCPVPLARGVTVRVGGALRNPALSGLMGEVVSRHPAYDAILVRFAAPHGEVVLKAANLTVAVPDPSPLTAHSEPDSFGSSIAGSGSVAAASNRSLPSAGAAAGVDDSDSALTVCSRDHKVLTLLRSKVRKPDVRQWMADAAQSSPPTDPLAGMEPLAVP